VRRRAGFTLIEILAVVLLIALIAMIVAPGLGFTAAQALDDHARTLAADLEFARQRSVMTGVPHRVRLDLDAGTWRLEWEVAAEDEPEPEEEPEPFATGVLGVARGTLDLAPPRRPERAFLPLPAGTGRQARLDPAVFLARVATGEGVVDRGSVGVAFAPDGTADPAEIVLRDESGFGVVLEVRALADAVRVRDAAR
jgi:type II secretion system protein H